MYFNLSIDVCANMVLVFAWEGKERENVSFALLGEDPTSGNPVLFMCGPYSDLADAARSAWNWIILGDFFDIYQFSGTNGTIVAEWGRAYGLYFSSALDVATSKSRKVSGVVLTAWSNRRKPGKASSE